jgi:hypothetical protein
LHIDETITIKEFYMDVGTLLLVLLVLIVIGAFPAWPHSRNWGYYPTSGAGVALIVLVVLLLTGHHM